jgi:hypothetical protein
MSSSLQFRRRPDKYALRIRSLQKSDALFSFPTSKIPRVHHLCPQQLDLPKLKSLLLYTESLEEVLVPRLRGVN